MKGRLKKEGNETLTNCKRLKLVAEDGKWRLTDVVTTEEALRLIQSIPSPKAEQPAAGEPIELVPGEEVQRPEKVPAGAG